MSVRKKCKCACEILKNIVENRASFTSEQVIVSYPGEILSQATSTLSRINLKTQLLPRKRIKCSPSTLTSAFSKSSVFAVHTNTLSRRFHIYPLWRAFSKSSVSGHRKRRFSVDGRPIRIKKLRFQIYPA